MALRSVGWDGELTANGINWAMFVLNQEGIDATLEECQRRLTILGLHDDLISDADLQDARTKLKQDDPTKLYPSKADRRFAEALFLLATCDGRKAVRSVLKALSKEDLHEVLGL